MNKLSFILLVLVISSCGNDNNSNQPKVDSIIKDTAISNVDSIEVTEPSSSSLLYDHQNFWTNDSLKFTPCETRNCLIHESLSDIERKKYSNKIMEMDWLYSAYWISKQHQLGEITPYIIFTDADNWNKSFLMTVDRESNLIDFVPIASDYGDGYQEDDYSVGYSKHLEFVANTDSTFYTKEIRITQKFKKEESFQLNDSIITHFLIQTSGKIIQTQKDSIHFKTPVNRKL